jgi:hypothetical protein
MMSLEFTNYVSPDVEIIEVNVEKGYSSSPDSGNLEDPVPDIEITFP